MEPHAFAGPEQGCPWLAAQTWHVFPLQVSPAAQQTAVGPGAGQQTAPPPGQAGGAAGQFPLQSMVPEAVAPQALAPEVQAVPR